MGMCLALLRPYFIETLLQMEGLRNGLKKKTIGMRGEMNGTASTLNVRAVEGSRSGPRGDNSTMQVVSAHPPRCPIGYVEQHRRGA
jgi:hypothetical protein